MSTVQRTAARKRLKKLQELDNTTKVPFIMVELRGHSSGDGYIEICGKDEYGVYAALDEWLTSTWCCTKLEVGGDGEGTAIPFCDALYRWGGFLSREGDGLNNMGLATMQLVDLMCRQLSWTLGVINGGNVGRVGEIREQQVIFKAPHPMNMVAPHVLVELRSVGSIAVSGDAGAMDILHEHWLGQLGAQPRGGHEDFCHRYYECPNDMFKVRGQQGENNLGLLTTEVCDTVVKLLRGWSLVTLNGGNHGEDGTHREQQLVFRSHGHRLGEEPHLLVELREAGFVEVNGQNVGGIQDKLQQWLKRTWNCCDQLTPSEGRLYDRVFTWEPKDMLAASAEITGFFHRSGWQMEVCSQGSVAIEGCDCCREQQILFRPKSVSSGGFKEPHLFIELYTGEGLDELHAEPEVTQMLHNQRIRICEVGDCGVATKRLRRFIGDYLGGSCTDAGASTGSGDIRSFSCDIFLSRGLTDNNLGLWTMRICDFMVDRLGWSFVVCNVCSRGATRQVREQQLVFRYCGDRLEIPLARETQITLDPSLFKNVQFPAYWQTPDVLGLRQLVGIVSCERDEVQALQEILDVTFKRSLARDGVQRLEAVHAFRSEHAELFRRLAQCHKGGYAGGAPLQAKTRLAGSLLNGRLQDGEALLAHGTNPSSAMGILRSGFRLSNAGKSTGMLFGHGIYLAECASQSDNYACDDGGGNYPGLRALLLCRCFVGKPYIVRDVGDYIEKARSSGCHCVVGNREAMGLYREFIFFDERQVFPEYAVIYRRQRAAPKAPARFPWRWPLASAKEAAARLRGFQRRDSATRGRRHKATCPQHA